MKAKVLYLFALIVLTIASWLAAFRLLGYQTLGNLILLTIGIWLFVLALLLAVRRPSAGPWIGAGLLILVGLLLPTSTLVQILPDRWSLPLGSLMTITLGLILPLALVNAALLLQSGLKLTREWRNAGAVAGVDSATQPKHAGRTAAVCFVLSALLIAKLLHTLYWFTVWDATDDPLGYIWLYIPGLVVLFCGVVLLIALPGRMKLAGLLYALIPLALMIVVSARAQRIDFRQLTQERAGRVAQAIETYYAREGRYPHGLQQLVPRDILLLPKPAIIYGQSWCYDGGDAYYRLGYVYREHWSAPILSGRIYKTEGEAPDLPGICDAEIAALAQRYPVFGEQR